MCFVSLLVLILLFSAYHIFSELPHAANASLALCKTARLKGVNAGGLSRNADGSFGFCSRASWNVCK